MKPAGDSKHKTYRGKRPRHSLAVPVLCRCVQRRDERGEAQRDAGASQDDLAKGVHGRDAGSSHVEELARRLCVGGLVFGSRLKVRTEQSDSWESPRRRGTGCDPAQAHRRANKLVGLGHPKHLFSQPPRVAGERHFGSSARCLWKPSAGNRAKDPGSKQD